MKLKHLLTTGPLLMLVFLLASACSHDEGQTGGDGDVDYYTCTMHPSVRSHDPHGKCPICSMDLVPVLRKHSHADSTNGDQAQAPGMTGDTNQTEQPTTFAVPVGRQQMIGVTYATVDKKTLQSTLRTVGTVTYDKLRHWDYVSRIEGYVQKLEVSSRGDLVGKNQPLMTIYSPDLLTTQREFLDLLRMRDEAQKAHSEAALQSAQNLHVDLCHCCVAYRICASVRQDEYVVGSYCYWLSYIGPPGVERKYFYNCIGYVS